MGKKITITYQVTYNLTGKTQQEYLEWLDDNKDTKKSRRWWAIDRFIGHHNLPLFDKKAKIKIEEK